MELKFKRHKFLLNFLYLVNEPLSKTDIQKHIFLIRKVLSISYYNFMPYRYGAYSLELSGDLDLLIERRFLEIENNKIFLNKKYNLLNNIEIDPLKKYISEYINLKGKDLISYVYKNFTYYAINSLIAKDYLSKLELDKFKLNIKSKAFFTIGYEGLKIEGFIKKLINNDIKILCDVRKNPLSRKKGFSLKSLSNILENVGIKYIHLPEFGIESKDRKNLSNNYNKLFLEYDKSLLNLKSSLNKLNKLYNENKRLAITCFEKDHNTCHRHRISLRLKELYKIDVVNL